MRLIQGPSRPRGFPFLKNNTPFNPTDKFDPAGKPDLIRFDSIQFNRTNKPESIPKNSKLIKAANRSQLDLTLSI